jgi:hypothetical protein
MRRPAAALAVLLVAAAAAVAILALTPGSSHTPPRRHISARVRPARARCSSVLGPSDDVAAAIVSARDGDVICLSSGSFPEIAVSNAQHDAYVTVEPAPHATAVVDGVQTNSDTFLRFRGLDMRAGFNMVGPGDASHDLQFIDNNIGHTTFGLVIDGTGAPIRDVLIEGNAIHDLDFTGPSAGYAGGQGVTVFWGSDIRVTHNTFWANSWHYIQCGTCDGMMVDHNLFTGPSNMHAGAHLNVWQIWAGSADDTFTANDVIGAPGAPIAAGAILWETGPGGAVIADSYRDMTISDNLFVDEDVTTTLDIAASTGLTITNNTIVGSTYGLLIRGRCTCAAGLDVPGRDYNISHNIVVRDSDPGARFRVFCPMSGFCGEDNVSDDDSAKTAFPADSRATVDWSPKWVTTTPDSADTRTLPRGFYEPVGLGLSAGNQTVADP